MLGERLERRDRVRQLAVGPEQPHAVGCVRAPRRRGPQVVRGRERPVGQRLDERLVGPVLLAPAANDPRLVPALAVLIGALAGWLLSRPLNWLLGRLFAGFHRSFAVATGGYTRAVGGLLRVSVLVLVLYGGLLALTYAGFNKAPKGFIPAQDKGYLLVNVQLPDSASVLRTQRV